MRKRTSMNTNPVDVTVYYSLQDLGGSSGVVLSPIQSADEKAQAAANRRYRAVITLDNLRLIMFIMGEIDDVEIFRWHKWLSAAQTEQEPPFTLPKYWEDASGVGH